MIINSRIDRVELERLNRRLVDHYGKGPKDLPYFRVVWGADEFEKRVMTHTDEGLELINPEVRTVPKYWMDVRHKYILESLTIVPEYVDTDLVENLTYEPKWVFEDDHGVALYPRWDAINMVLQTMRVNVESAGRRPAYKNPEVGEDDKETAYLRKQRIDQIQEDLFGEETSVTDALKLGTGIVVPGVKS